MDLNHRLQAASAKIAARRDERRDAITLLREAEKALAAAEKAEEAANQAAAIVAKLAEARASMSVAAFEKTATQCLQAIFGADHRVVLSQNSAAGKSTVSIAIQIGDQVYDPISSCGGGIVDVLCFGLRLASLVYDVSRPRKLLILDEPFRFVSREYRPRVAAMLESLADSCGVQIIMVTHQPELEVGSVVRLGNPNVEQATSGAEESTAVE